MPKISKLNIVKFRHLDNVDIVLGRRITAIAGQNGIGKSSLLGLVGHIFTYPAKYKTLDNKTFATQQSEIFRFSYPDYDRPKEHIYNVELDTGDIVPVISSARTEKGQEEGLRLNVGQKMTGRGKRELPVIYLGLRRLFPLAQEIKVTENLKKVLTQKEAEFYQHLHNEILLLEESITPQYIEGFSKIFYGAQTDRYNSLGNSAGQDNIGQILTALLSFKRLKEELGSEYKGGLLLIDELDATLYPAAQVKLLEKLFRISQDLDLQVIFTTHSLDVLQKILEPKYQNDATLVYLSRARGFVENEQNKVALQDVINDLRVLAPNPEKINKVPVFCEDREAFLWLKNLLGRDLCAQVEIYQETFGGDHLKTLASKKIPIFRNSIFVLDGDMSAAQQGRCPHVISLPGGERPENIFYKFLKILPQNDAFWGGVGRYTKQVCFRDAPRIESADRRNMKDWFNSQGRHWGRGYSKLFNRWKEENSTEADVFKNEFDKIIQQIRKFN